MILFFVSLGTVFGGLKRKGEMYVVALTEMSIPSQQMSNPMKVVAAVVFGSE